MYRVIEQFADLQDDSHVYNPGDEFPRAGVLVKPERYAELAGSNNKIGRPLIEKNSAHVAPAGDKAEEIPDESKKAVKKPSAAKKPAKKK